MLMDADRRLLADVDLIDDRGLEHAEALIHELRQHAERTGCPDDRIARALTALDGVRTLTRTSAGACRR